MPLQIASLNSGSNGNCYYVGNESDAVLIDVGISCREIERRLVRLGSSIQKVKAVFISHEHSDHIKGLETLVAKYKLPVFITEKTLAGGKLRINRSECFSFYAHQPTVINSMQITGFPKYHDAIDPHSFLVRSEGVSVGVFTDIGAPCPQLINYFSQCQAAFLEANYDKQMLQRGHYPYYLKKRISSGNGHLSNDQALELFLQHKHPGLSELVLSHLSKENNCPELVQKLFSQHTASVRIHVASREKESEMITISQPDIPAFVPKASKPMQLGLFDFAAS